MPTLAIIQFPAATPSHSATMADGQAHRSPRRPTPLWRTSRPIAPRLARNVADEIAARIGGQVTFAATIDQDIPDDATP